MSSSQMELPMPTVQLSSALESRNPTLFTKLETLAKVERMVGIAEVSLTDRTRKVADRVRGAVRLLIVLQDVLSSSLQQGNRLTILLKSDPERSVAVIKSQNVGIWSLPTLSLAIFKLRKRRACPIVPVAFKTTITSCT